MEIKNRQHFLSSPGRTSNALTTTTMAATTNSALLVFPLRLSCSVGPRVLRPLRFDPPFSLRSPSTTVIKTLVHDNISPPLSLNMEPSLSFVQQPNPPTLESDIVLGLECNDYSSGAVLSQVDVPLIMFGGATSAAVVTNKLQDLATPRAPKPNIQSVGSVAFRLNKCFRGVTMKFKQPIEAIAKVKLDDE